MAPFRIDGEHHVVLPDQEVREEASQIASLDCQIPPAHFMRRHASPLARPQWLDAPRDPADHPGSESASLNRPALEWSFVRMVSSARLSCGFSTATNSASILCAIGTIWW